MAKTRVYDERVTEREGALTAMLIITLMAAFVVFDGGRALRDRPLPRTAREVVEPILLRSILFAAFLAIVVQISAAANAPY